MSSNDDNHPISPGSASPPDENDQYVGNGLHTEETDEGLEKIWDYEEGGHHPVHLDDCLGDKGEYRVIHKLGSGGFANVWLCRILNSEPPRYVAVKILMADASADDCPERRICDLQKLAATDREIPEYFCLPEDQFQINGPNGSHLCFVYPVGGPKAADILKRVDDPDKTLRTLVRQAVHAMATLHRHGICHGDFRPPNVLLRQEGLNGHSEEEVLEYLEHPRITKVLTRDGESPMDPSAPLYLVYPVEYHTRNSGLASDQICVIDLGESYDISDPPEDLGIPLPYRAPEVIFDKKCGPPSDIWALACTMFEIRTGRRLFAMVDDFPDDYLCLVAELFGPFPEPWWSTAWETRRKYFEDALDSEGRPMIVPPSTQEGEDDPRTLLRDLRDKVLHAPKYTASGELEFSNIPEEEVESFGDLLRKMFEYDPEKRPSVEEVLMHPWFSL